MREAGGKRQRHREPETDRQTDRQIDRQRGGVGGVDMNFLGVSILLNVEGAGLGISSYQSPWERSERREGQGQGQGQGQREGGRGTGTERGRGREREREREQEVSLKRTPVVVLEVLES